jgi:hypothetical protein
MSFWAARMAKKDFNGLQFEGDFDIVVGLEGLGG